LKEFSFAQQLSLSIFVTKQEHRYPRRRGGIRGQILLSTEKIIQSEKKILENPSPPKKISGYVLWKIFGGPKNLFLYLWFYT